MTTLLIVDNQPELAGLMSEYFDCRGFAVEHTSSALDAIMRAQQTPFDVVISDYQLDATDQMNGIELLSRLKTLIGCKSILLSGMLSEPVRSRATSRKIDLVVSKPIAMRDLEQLIVAMTGSGPARGQTPDRWAMEALHVATTISADVPVEMIAQHAKVAAKEPTMGVFQWLQQLGAQDRWQVNSTITRAAEEHAY